VGGGRGSDRYIGAKDPPPPSWAKKGGGGNYPPPPPGGAQFSSRDGLAKPIIFSSLFDVFKT